MSSKQKLLNTQIAWALSVNKRPDSRGYLSSVEDNLFKPLSPDTFKEFSAGSGSELVDSGSRPAKMKALHSSAALAINVFDYWRNQDQSKLATILGLECSVDSLEFEAQFPTGLGGTPPNLDLALRFDDDKVTGIESKFSEWLTPKPANKEHFKPKYFPTSNKIWEKAGLPRSQQLATRVHIGNIVFRFLDATQLLKHMLGLATSHTSSSQLIYIFYDWPSTESEIHQQEVESFANLIAGDMPYQWLSYQALFQKMKRECSSADQPYLDYLQARYFPIPPNNF